MVEIINKWVIYIIYKNKVILDVFSQRKVLVQYFIKILHKVLFSKNKWFFFMNYLYHV